jgi:hypothetical protein
MNRLSDNLPPDPISPSQRHQSSEGFSSGTGSQRATEPATYTQNSPLAARSQGDEAPLSGQQSAISDQHRGGFLSSRALAASAAAASATCRSAATAASAAVIN